MIRKIFFLLLNTLVMTVSGQEHKMLHDRMFLLDAHNDVLSGAVAGGWDISTRLQQGNTDLVRLKQGGVDAQVFVVFCNGSYGKGTAFQYAWSQIDSLEAIVRRNPGKIVLARTRKEVTDAFTEGKIAALLAVEGGHMIEDSLALLERFAAKGVRYMTLTWNNSTSWASSAADETRTNQPLPAHKKGLTSFGKEVVRRMNALGMVVDLAHVGERTFYDALETSTQPVIVSHGNAWALCPVARNLKDDQIRAVAKKGGVIGITFYAPFLDPGYYGRIDTLIAQHPALADSLTRQGLTRDRMIGALLDAFPEEADRIRPPVSLVADHIDHIVKIAGIDHVGLAGDYFGMAFYPFPQGLGDVTGYPLITRELLARGYSHEAISKILGLNFLRVLVPDN